MKNMRSLICLSVLMLCGALAACGEASSDTQSSLPTPAENSSAEQTTSAASQTAPVQNSAEQTTASSASTTAPASQSSTLTSAVSAEPPAETTTTPAAAVGGHLFDQIRINDVNSDYFSKHKDFTMTEASSCIGYGKDCVYKYANYEIHTFKGENAEVVQEIWLTGKGIATREGIEVGMTFAEAEAKYGEPEIPGIYTFTTADGTLEFTSDTPDGNTISTIVLFAEG